MDNIVSTFEETMIINLIYLSFKTLKDAFVHLRGKLRNILNQISLSVATEIIWRLNV